MSDKPEEKAEPRNPYKSLKSNRHSGHRQRMKNRYAIRGFDGFNEHEILEMILFRCLPQGNTNEIAHDLLDTFGSLEQVLAADRHALMRVNGIKEQSALYLKFLYDVFCSFEKQKIIAEKSPSDTTGEEDVLRFLFASFYGKSDEELMVVFLNAAGEKITAASMGIGITNKMEVSIRKIVREAVRCDCTQLVIAHNHPSGLLIPSQEDLTFTNTLSKRLHDVDIQLKTHYLIVNRSYLIIGDDFRCYPGKELHDLSAQTP